MTATVWGDRTYTTTINCNGKPLVISTNLGIALRRFRQTFKTRTLWADAVCINQADLVERSQQVSLMSAIYSKAEHVLAWLGHDEKGDAKFAFGRMSEINEWLEIKWADKPLDCHDVTTDTVTVSVLKPDHRLLQGEGVKRALESFFKRPYFARAWVQQEIGLAKDVNIYWGEWTISWNIIRRCIWYIPFVKRFHGKYPGRLSNVADVFPGPLFHTSVLFASNAQMDRSYGIFNVRRDPLKTDTPKFSSVLSNARALEAEDPRDLVFSLLSHPAAMRVHGGSIIKADYTKSLSEIMWELTATIIFDDLGILSAVFHDEESLQSAAPSWVPDLPRFRTSNRVSKLEYWCYYRSGISSRDAKAVVKMNDARTVITLRGLFLDIIAMDSKSFGIPGFDSQGTTQHPLYLTLDFVRSDRNHRRYFNQNHVLLSSLILVGGKPYLDGENHEANFYAYCKEHSLSPATSADLMSEASVTDPQIVEYADCGNSTEYKSQAWAACYQSKLFRTSKGYLGLGPEILKPGDVVAVIFGAKVPFILRPEGDHYLLLGDCYVHGIMKGEAVEEWAGANPEKFDDVEFEIH